VVSKFLTLAVQADWYLCK